VIAQSWSWWHQLEHYLGTDGAGSGGSGFWYLLWSGSLGILILVPSALLVLWHHTCHVPTCIRPGKHPTADGTYKLCRRHHPDVPNRLSHQAIVAAHREAQAP